MFRGFSDYRNSATPLVIEYMERKRLAGLGFQFPIEEISAWKADALVIIDRKHQQIESEPKKK